MTRSIDKASLDCNQPRRTPNDPNKSHVVKACYDGKQKLIHFGEQGASTAGKPKAGESDRMKAKRASFKARHAKNIAKGPSSAAYWANKVKWADGGLIGLAQKYVDEGTAKTITAKHANQSDNYALGGLVRKYDEGGDVAVPDTQPSIMGALKDPQFRQDVANNFRDASYRGAVAGTLGAPVDIANMLANMGTAGYGYLGHKLGLLKADELPATYNEPVGGSEWIGNKLRDYGVIGGNRNPTAEVLAGLGLPLAPVAAEARIPQMDRALEQMAANYATKDDMNTAKYMGQMGAVKLPGGNWLAGSGEDSLLKPGGNWLAGSVEDSLLKPLQAQVRGPAAVRRLREIEEAYAQNVEAGVPVDDAFMQRVREQTKPDVAINNWIDKQLAKYVKNDMATPEDPLRIMADKYAVDKPAKLAEVQGRIDAFAAKMEQTARERGVPVGDLTSMRQQMIGLEKEKALVEARQGLHFEPQQRGPQVAEELRHIREMEGLPGAGFGQSELARRWETATDKVIRPEQARTFLNTHHWETGIPTVENNPWLLKVPPETKVYGLSSSMPESLGLDHLIDELRNATRPDTDLPERLRIDHNKLDRMTVPQIVEKVADINAWRSVNKAEANFALANNPATFIHKQYPNGMKWVQLRQSEEQLPDIGDMLRQNEGKYSIVEPGEKLGWKDPSSGRVLFDTPEAAAAAYGKSKNYKSLEDALKYEGDTMVNCVGGYCNRVLEGKSEIFSLRNAEGQPFATIEVQPESINSKVVQMDPNYLAFAKSLAGKEPYEKEVLLRAYFAENQPPARIVQIKGLNNGAVDKKYWPLVQDFVNSGTWSDVGDLHNAGLFKHPTGKYVSHEEANALARRHFGNSFGNKPDQSENALQYYNRVKRYDQEMLSDTDKGFIADWDAGNFAAGGSVRAYAQGGDVAAEPSFLGALKRWMEPTVTYGPETPQRSMDERGIVSGTPFSGTPLEQDLYKQSGMEPGLDRSTWLPIAGSREKGNLQLAVPGALYGIAKAANTPGAAARGVPVSKEEAMDVAMNLVGTGLGTSHAIGPAAEAGKTMLGMAVKAQGDLNLTPMARAEILKGPEAQTPENFLNQLRGKPGMTQEGFDDLVKRYQGLEPGTRMTKAEFEQRIPASEYNKVDLANSAESADAHLLQQAQDMVMEDWFNIYEGVLDRLGARASHENLQMLGDYHNNTLTFDELTPDLQRGLTRVGATTPDRVGVLDDLFAEERDNAVNNTYQTLREQDYAYSGLEPGGYAYKDHQRLLAKPGSHSDKYFEFGVTHPEQSGEYWHYPGHEGDEGLIGHVRGTFIGDDTEVTLIGGGYAKPRSMVIEEIQSDAQKKAGQSGPLRQAHGTMFKAAVQHALENGADTVYLPTAEVIGAVRHKPASAYAPIYDQQIVKEGLKPLLKIPGVSVNKAGGYHEINFTPEAKDFILKGEGQAAPGYAQGGAVRAYDPSRVDQIMNSINTPRNYAEGGSVRAYDPGRVDAIVKQFM